MKKYLLYSLLYSLVFVTWSCEEPIDIDTNPSPPQLTVDGWITTELKEQRIKLTFSQDYFTESFNPPALGASVTVVDDKGTVYTFSDDDNDGVYTWMPTDTPLGRVGGQYGLQIVYEGETFVSASEIRPVPAIDSLVYRYEEESLGMPEGYYAELFATDFIGKGDCYWIKTYKNGEYLNKPFELNISYDGGFSAGNPTDGITFIRPIREGINPVPDPDLDPTPPPYEIGDSIYVELHAIPQEAFFYLAELTAQLQNGGLFAVPTTNIPTNIINTNPDSDVQALGFFGASAVNSAGVRIEE